MRENQEQYGEHASYGNGAQSGAHARMPAYDAGAGGLPEVPASSAEVRNRLLHALAPDDYAWLAAHLTPVPMPAKLVLYSPNESIRDVYFPETGVVSVINRMDDGSVVEVGTIGPEGFVGLSAVLDAESSPSETIVQVGGHGYRAPAAAVLDAFGARPALRRVLARYAHAYLTQVAQTAACNASHPVDERCARWLLMTHDRVNYATTFELTHQFLAVMLGVRRAGVTVAAQALQQAGLIRYARGRVSVLDRRGLEEASCECYGIVRREFDRLVGGNTGAR